jgi:hypothetical protein
MNPSEQTRRLMKIVDEDLAVLEAKNAEYGQSWLKRGGVGAFMMIARKWDRLETQCRIYNWDIFEMLNGNDKLMEDTLDTIRDLRRYLLLVEDHYLEELGPKLPREYINPDL